MAFDMFKVNRQREVLELLLQGGIGKSKKQAFPNNTPVIRKDCITLSAEAMKIQQSSCVYGQTENIKIDKSIDIQSYFDAAIASNQDAIENARAEITDYSQNHSVYTDGNAVYRQILTDKYRKLVEEAKKHDNPKQYIEQKYFDPSCSWYAADLTKEERGIGYNNEISMLRKGTTNGVNYHDSFFRVNNITVTYDNDASFVSFNRQMLNAEINNILEEDGIDVDESADYLFHVDPCSYFISVDCEDDILKEKMEAAFNVGNNGKNLWQHIYWCSTRDYTNSSQSGDTMSYHKHRVYQEVYKYTGYKLNELKELNDTYYTEDGTDIKVLIKDAVVKDLDVPLEYKTGAVQGIWQRISEVSGKGWNNIADMTLAIGFSGIGLHDLYQDISFDVGSEYIRRQLCKNAYCVMKCEN